MIYKLTLYVVLAFSFAACKNEQSRQNSEEVATGNTLTDNQLQNGFGPISSLELTALDPELALKGNEIFNTKCATCHKFDQRYVGPSLAGLMERRTPAFIMNMMLNPAEMVEKHPEVKQMLAEYLTPMPFQNLSEEDARAVLEYLREATQSAEENS